MTSLSALDPLIFSMSLLKHSFYQQWSKGELTREDLKVYAKEYFHLVERIPGIVASVAERASSRTVKDMIAKNVTEEQEHVELWKRFAKSLGIAERALLAYTPSAKTQAAVRSLEQLAKKDFASGVAAVYALELELPAIAKTKKEGLCAFYGLESEGAHIYFDEHLKEEAHLEVWRAMPLLDGDRTQAARTSMIAQHQVLDAVCEECGISMECPSVP